MIVLVLILWVFCLLVFGSGLLAIFQVDKALPYIVKRKDGESDKKYRFRSRMIGFGLVVLAIIFFFFSTFWLF